MKTGKLSFKIEGEYLTWLARHMWVEGNPVKAIRLLREGLEGEEGAGLHFKLVGYRLDFTKRKVLWVCLFSAYSFY